MKVGDKVRVTDVWAKNLNGQTGTIVAECGDLFGTGKLWFDVRFPSGLSWHYMAHELSEV